MLSYLSLPINCYLWKYDLAYNDMWVEQSHCWCHIFVFPPTCLEPERKPNKKHYLKGKPTPTQGWLMWTAGLKVTWLTCLFSFTGPLSPQPVTIDLVGTDQLNLSWNVSAFMQMTPHSYNVTICTSTCDTLLHSYTNGSALMNVNISSLNSATEYFISVAAVVVRPDSVTGGETILQSDPTALLVRTGRMDSVVLLQASSIMMYLIFSNLTWFLVSSSKFPFLPELYTTMTGPPFKIAGRKFS